MLLYAEFDKFNRYSWGYLWDLDSNSQFHDLRPSIGKLPCILGQCFCLRHYYQLVGRG